MPSIAIVRLLLELLGSGSFQVTRAIFLFLMNFSCRYGNAMQEAGNLVVSDDEKSFYVMFHF